MYINEASKDKADIFKGLKILNVLSLNLID